MLKNIRYLAARLTAFLPVLLLVGFLTSSFVWLVFSPKIAQAADIVVNSLTDNDVCDANECTLRGAMGKALSTTVSDTITINVSGTINLLTDLPVMDSSLAINGPGADKLTVRRGPNVSAAFGIFVIYRDEAVTTPITVSISSITISNGKWLSNSAFTGGGAVYNYRADVFLRNLVVTNNEAYEGGGGIMMDTGASPKFAGRMFIEDSVVSNNKATATASRDVGKGGGIYLNGGTGNIIRNVLVYNNVGNRGGGINIAGDSLQAPLTYISNSMVISNQATTSNGNAYNTNSLGGGIGTGVPGRLFIDSTIISGNLAWGGGGMYSEGDKDGFITVTNSLFYGNTATKNPVNLSSGCGQFNGIGGGYLADPHGPLGTLTIVNSTFAKNKVIGCPGGGLYTDVTSAIIANSTFVENSSVPLVGGTSTVRGGGIDNTNGQTQFYIQNSIVASNTINTNTPDDVRGTILSQGYNFIGNSDSSAGWVASDIRGTAANLQNPQLEGIQNNGGATPSYKPLPGSPVINSGNPAGCSIPTTNIMLTTDQRGFPRPAGNICDRGAIEVQPFLIDLNGQSNPGWNYSVSFTENSAPVATGDPALYVYSDAASLSGATVRITNLQDPAAESLVVTTTGTAITSDYNSATGTLTLSGTDTLANYKTVLQSIKYSSTSDNPGASRLIEFVGTSNLGTGSAVTTTVTIIAVNDAPVFSLAPQLTAKENLTSTVAGINLVDPDANSGVLSVTLSVASGSLSFGNSSGLTFKNGVSSGASLTFSGTLTSLNNGLATLVYSPTQQYFSGPVSFNLAADDHGNTGQGGVLTTSLQSTINVLSALFVTNNADAGDTSSAGFGSLSYALNAVTDPNRTTKVINFSNTLTSIMATPGLNYTVPKGVTLQGRCGPNGAEIELNGNGGTPPNGVGLTLNGGANVSGLAIRNFNSTQLLAKVVGANGKNTLSCVRASRN